MIYGRLVHIDPDNPRATAYCDKTGFPCMRHDLVKQYQYHGQSLVWTGFWVHKDYVDKPSPWMKTIILKADPVPVREPKRGLGADTPVVVPDAGTNPQRLEELQNVGTWNQKPNASFIP